METFIRLDRKGTWRGTEHQSRTAAWEWEEDDRYLEDGVSCFYATVEGIEELYDYAINHMSLYEERDQKDFQVTVFEGNYNGQGSDGEELAWCTATLKEIESLDWFKTIEKAKEMADTDEDGEYYDDDKDEYVKGITQEEYEEIILKATGLK